MGVLSTIGKLIWMSGRERWGTEYRCVYLRTETTRSSSSMENTCVIAIDPGG